MRTLFLLALLFIAISNAHGQYFHTFEVITYTEQTDTLRVYGSLDRFSDDTLLYSFPLPSPGPVYFYWDNPCYTFRTDSASTVDIEVFNSHNESRFRTTLSTSRLSRTVCQEPTDEIPGRTMPPCIQSVYPNPTFGRLYTDECEGVWTIYDFRGRYLSTQKHPDLSNTYFPTGVYHLVFDGDTRQTFKIIKQ